MKPFQSLDVRFHNKQNISIAAKLDLPSHAEHFAIFSPCFTCTKETLATYRVSQALAKKNIAVLRLDFTGLGESDGDFCDSNFSTMIDDIMSANDFLSQHYKPAAMLIGHSMGGTASYAAASLLHDIKAVVSIASPSSPEHVLHHFGDALEKIKAGLVSEFYVAGRAYPIKPQFLADLDNHDLTNTLQSLHKAILIFHADSDNLVNIDHANKIYAHATYPKSLISLDSADHVLSNRDDAQYVADLIHQWSSRYLATNNS